MIILRLKFANEDAKEFEIVDGERLNDAVTRALADVPAGKYKNEDVWLVVVNGHVVEGDTWEHVALKPEDRVTISPKIRDGDSGQIIKTVLLVVVAVVASVIFSPAAGAGFWASVASGLEIAAVTIGASLLLNALIPPPVAKLGDISGVGGGLDSSQMYAFSGQSNQMNRLGSCPTLYGKFRMFPTIAAIPYTEISTSEGTFAKGSIGLNLVFTAKEKGTIGNTIKLIFQGGGVAGSESVVINTPTSTITVTYQLGVSTATQVKAAMLANATVAALINITLTGAGSTIQTDTSTFNLSGGTNAGETVQYLYAVYDFGIGTFDISEMKIGDTPISSNSFQDFNYNLVDVAKTVDEDIWDQGLKTTFQYYKMAREITSLAIAINADGDSTVQNSDVNADHIAQELVLDFVCPRGLFGFSSNGTLGSRNVDVGVDFALVGTNDWQSFNDLTAVTSHQVIGGSEISEFKVNFGASIAAMAAFGDLYYESKADNEGKLGTSINYFVKPGQQNLVLEPGEYPQWANVFVGNRFLGKIESVDFVSAAPLVVVTLDRVVTDKHYDICAYGYWALLGPGPLYGEQIRISGNGSGVATITGKSTSPVYGSIRFTPKNPGQYQVRVRRIRSYGDYTTQTQDGITWGALTTAYFKSPVNTTIRHTMMELRIRATDQLNGNISTLSAVCRSVIPVYNPGTGAWVREISNNPAWVFADLLTGQVNKRPISRDKLHLNSLVEWADFCDEIPTPPPSQAFTEKRFTCNFILDYQATLAEVLAQVGSSAQASLNLIDNKYGVLIDKFRSTPVQIFTPRNSRDFSSVRHYSRRPDGVKITWIDPNLDWVTQEVVVYDNGFNAGNAQTFDSLTAFACTNHEQAWRFGRYMIAQNRLRQETISILVDFENLACTRGDFVQITQDVMKAGGTPMRVKAVVGSHITTDDSIDVDPALSYGYIFRSTATGTISAAATMISTAPNEFDVAGTVPVVGDLIIIGEMGFISFDCIVKGIAPNDDQSAQLILIEKADGIYDYESSDVLPDYNPQLSPLTDPNFRPPAAVINLVVSDNTWRCSPLRSGHDYYVDLAWDIPSNSVYELFEIWVNDGRGFRSVATTKIKTYRYFVDQDRLDLEHSFKVVAVSATGKKLELAAMTTVIATPTTKPTPPSDVQNFNVGITDQTLQLSWNKITDCDAFQYVLRYSPDVATETWELSVPLAIVTSDLNTFSCQARTGSYFVKAIDYAGNESANAAVAITTIPNLFGVTDIESIDEAPTFIGELDQTELLGAAVIITEQVHGDINTVQYYDLGYYTFAELLDLGDIYTVRLESLLQADGLKKGELMSDWVELELVDHLSSVVHTDWNVALEYRATTEFDSMADWTALNLLDHLNFGGGEGFTSWREIPQVGDVTGRIFQFRVRMESLSANVTPRVFDTTVNAYMPDRLESDNNLTSSASLATNIAFSTSFAGPSPAPAIQISVDNGATGDYWTFDIKDLNGFAIRFFDKNGVQVVRQFDWVAKGFGHKYSAVI